MDYKIFSNDYDSTIKFAQELRTKLNELDWKEKEDSKNIFVIGGDGSVLKAFNKEQHRIEDINIYAIHSGGLGFYTDFNGCDVNCIISAIKRNEWHEELINTVEIDIDGKKYYCLNELTIMSPLRPVIFDIMINDTKLQKFRSTGVAFSSAMGSTGFLKSLGGAVIDNDLNALEIVEIAPCSNNAYRSIGSPVVVAGNKKIKVKANFESCFFATDAIEINNSKTKEITITSGPKLKFIRYNKMEHFDRVYKSFVMEGKNNV